MSEMEQKQDSASIQRSGFSGMSITAFILSLFGFLLALPAVAALILGIVSLVRSNRDFRRRGLAIAAVVVSSLWILLFIVIGVANSGSAPTARDDAAVNDSTTSSSESSDWISDLRRTEPSMFEKVSDDDLRNLATRYCREIEGTQNAVATFGLLWERYPLSPVAVAAAAAFGATSECPGQETGALLMGKALDDGTFGPMLGENYRYAETLALVRQVLPEYDYLDDQTVVLGAIAGCRTLFTREPGDIVDDASMSPGTPEAKTVFMLMAAAEQTICTDAPRSSKEFVEAFANGD